MLPFKIGHPSYCCLYRFTSSIRQGSLRWTYVAGASLVKTNVCHRAPIYSRFRTCHTYPNSELLAVEDSSCERAQNDISQTNLRNFSVGKCVVERVLSEKLLVASPSASVSEIIAAVDSTIYLQSNLSISKANSSFGNLLSSIGCRYQDEGNLETVRGSVDDTFSFDHSGIGFERLVKLFYPKYFLQEILTAEKEDIHIKTRVTGSNKEGVKVGLFIDGRLVAESTGISFRTAEKDACRDYLVTNLEDRMMQLELPDDDSIAIEENIHFRDSQRQRKVQLVKEYDEVYGFYIRGGEQQELSSPKFRRFFYYSAPYISKIVQGSPAQKCGKIEVGDVILAVGDHRTKGLAHNSIIKLIKNAKDNLMLTVVSNPDVRIRDHLRLKDKERGMRKMKADVAPEKWRQWHLAQAEKNPQKYIKLIRELERNMGDS